MAMRDFNSHIVLCFSLAANNFPVSLGYRYVHDFFLSDPTLGTFSNMRVDR